MSVLSISSPTMVSSTWLQQTQQQSNHTNGIDHSDSNIANDLSPDGITDVSPEQSLAHGRVSMVAADSPQDKYKDIFQDESVNNNNNNVNNENYESRLKTWSSGGGGGGGKPRSCDDCSPEEKRQRFLERNRAAASRCRQKRKQWVNQLESKSHDLMTTNNMLVNEINALRREVAQLKALLMAHKDCPVTVQQKQLLNDVTPTSYVAAVSDGQIVAIQQVNNTVTAVSNAAGSQVPITALRDMTSSNGTAVHAGKAAVTAVSGGKLVTTF